MVTCPSSAATGMIDVWNGALLEEEANTTRLLPLEKTGKEMTPVNQDTQQVSRLPFKMLVLAELTPRDPQTRISPGRPVRIRIDKNNFNEVLARLGERLVLEVPNRLATTPQAFLVEIVLKDLTSFRPEAIAEQVPGLKNLLQIKELVAQLEDRSISRQDFQQRLDPSLGSPELLDRIRKALAAAPLAPEPVHPPRTPSGPSSQDTLDALLDMVEVPETTARPGPSRVESLIDSVISPSMGRDPSAQPVSRQALDAVMADLDATISAQVHEILHHAEFRRLESSWRGLKFLVDRTDFRENIQLEVLNAAKSSLLDVFQEMVFEPEYEGVSEAPVSVVIADYEFDRSSHDIDVLQELAQQVERLQVPFIASIGQGFLGLDSAGTLHRLPYIGEYFQRPEYVKWNAFRQSEASRWVSLGFNRFLLRLPYSPESDPVKTFAFEESISRGAGSYLWGNPVWALASLLTGSVARIGWPSEISGIRGGGMLENLPVGIYASSSRDGDMIPLETLISEQMVADLAANGLWALTCRANTDVALILSAPTTHRPERYADAAATAESALRAALPYQLAATRIVQHVKQLYSEVVPGNTLEGIQSDFARALRGCFSSVGQLAADAVRVEVIASEEHPDSHDMVLHIHPGREVLGGRVAVELRIHIRP